MWNEGAGTRPSTGQLALAAAVHLCEGRVSVFGFDRTESYSNQYHLAEPRSQLHDWAMETKVRAREPLAGEQATACAHAPNHRHATKHAGSPVRLVGAELLVALGKDRIRAAECHLQCG